MKTYSFVLLVALVLAGCEAKPNRHRVKPNQAVWEGIRDRMEQKKQAVPVAIGLSAAVAAAAPKPVVETAPQVEDVLTGLKKARHGLGPKFIQYNAKHPVGRKQLAVVASRKKTAKKMTTKHHSSQKLNSIERQINALKLQRKKRAQAEEAAREDAIRSAAQQPDPKRPWAHVWTPNEKNPQDPKAKHEKRHISEPADQSAPFEDPFAALHVNFAAEQAIQQKQVARDDEEKVKEKKSTAVAKTAQEKMDAELKANADHAVAEANGETKEDFIFDVDKDANGGLAAMEKDAIAMTSAADKESLNEAKAVGEKARQVKKAIYDIAARTEAKAADMEAAPAAPVAAPPPPKQQETLAEALNGEHEAEARQELDGTAASLGALWAKKTHDSKLNSELALDAKRNAQVVRERAEKVLEIEGDKAADQLDELDHMWQSKFPDAPSENSPRMAPANRKRATSSWGVLSADLSTSGVQSQ